MSNKGNKKKSKVVRRKILTQQILTEFENMAKYRMIPKPTGKTYWVADWSLSPMADGHEAYKTDISFRFKGKYCPIFGSKYGVRAYYPWQIWETKAQAQIIADWLNSLTAGYDFTAYYEFVDRIGGYHTIPEKWSLNPDANVKLTPHQIIINFLMQNK